MKYITLGFLILVLFSCSSPEQRILGRWQIIRYVSQGEEDTSNATVKREIEFQANNKFMIYDNGIEREGMGTYRLDGDSIFVTFKEFHSRPQTLSWHFILQPEKLTLQLSEIHYTILIPSTASASSIETAKKESIPLLERNATRDIRNYLSDYSITWRPCVTEYSGVGLSFSEYGAFYNYDRCTHDYPYEVTSDSTIDLLWQYSADPNCWTEKSREFYFLDNVDSLGVENYPKHGNRFATYTLVSQNLLRVKYYFPEWIKEVNKQENDSIYPTNWYRLGCYLK